MSGAPWSRVVGTVSAVRRRPLPKLIGARSIGRLRGQAVSRCGSGSAGARRTEILLNESGTQVNVELHERLIDDRGEGVYLARLDHEHVAGARLEDLPRHRPAAAARLDELELVVRMTVRPGPSASFAAEEEHGHADVAVVGANEVVRAPTKGQLGLSESKHGYRLIGS